MLKAEFDRSLTILITPLGSDSLRELNAMQVHSVVPLEDDQTMIYYMPAQEGRPKEEVVVREGHERVSELLSGYPTEVTKAEILAEIIHERIETATRNLANLEAVYDQDKDKSSGWHEIRYPEVIEELGKLNVNLPIQEKKVKSTKLGRYAMWLRNIIDHGLERSEGGRLSRLMQSLYERTVSSELKKQIKNVDRIRAEIRENLGFKEGLKVSDVEYKVKRIEEFHKEKARLIKVRDAPKDGYFDRERLNARINKRRERYQINHYFKFVQQDDGIYVNIRSKDYQDRQQVSSDEVPQKSLEHNPPSDDPSLER